VRSGSGKTRRAPPGPGREGEGPVLVVAGIVIEGTKVLIAQRPVVQSFGLKWEFPGGKVEAGETQADALVREFHEELGIEIRTREPYAEIRYLGPAGREIRVAFFRAERVKGTPQPLQVAAVAWVEGADLGRVDFIPANRPIVARLQRELTGKRGEGVL
jgi:8-oxo-dGTP diphosphatase